MLSKTIRLTSDFLISQIKDFSFIFNQVSEVILQSIGFPLVSSMIGPKSLCLCLNQSDANVKTITKGSLPFSRAFATWLIFTTGFHRCKSPHISITYQFLSDHMIQLKLMTMPGFVGSSPKKKKKERIPRDSYVLQPNKRTEGSFPKPSMDG